MYTPREIDPTAINAGVHFERQTLVLPAIPGEIDFVRQVRKTDVPLYQLYRLEELATEEVFDLYLNIYKDESRKKRKRESRM